MNPRILSRHYHTSNTILYTYSYIVFSNRNPTHWCRSQVTNGTYKSIRCYDDNGELKFLVFDRLLIYYGTTITCETKSTTLGTSCLLFVNKMRSQRTSDSPSLGHIPSLLLWSNVQFREYSVITNSWSSRDINPILNFFPILLKRNLDNL